MKRTASGLRACAVRRCKNPTATRFSLKCIEHQDDKDAS
jgi:hypothetical protein